MSSLAGVDGSLAGAVDTWGLVDGSARMAQADAARTMSDIAVAADIHRYKPLGIERPPRLDRRRFIASSTASRTALKTAYERADVMSRRAHLILGGA